ncbi:MAG TPA: molybdopterin-dependent oxidoreductase [Candidatus Thermoplasmatota archaeon]|nr:molybdopterin-dependent oxidoreductase [Candidatus Thermoplasmatota archaeon]
MALRFYGACPRNCYDTCGQWVTLAEDGSLKVEGDAEHPVTRGFLCGKGYANVDLHDHRERLLHPLRRVGPKGPGKGSWERISWDEALDEIARRMTAIAAQGTPERVLEFHYSGHMGFLNRYFPLRLWRAFGATETLGTICAAAGGPALSLHYGNSFGLYPTDYAEADLIVVWGSNLAWSSPHVFALIKEAARKGTPVFVVDPLASQTTKIGTHLQVRPTTDVVLALAVARELFEQGLTADEFLKSQTLGVEEFRVHCAPWTLERAAEVTGVPAAQIRALAEAFGRAKRPAVHIGFGVQRNVNGGEIVRAVGLLPALRGAPRGFYFSNGNLTYRWDIPWLGGAHLRKGTATLNMVQLGRALQENRFDMVFVWNANPLATLPNLPLVREGMLREGLFTVVHDLFLTDTCDYADIVLPATSIFESPDLVPGYYHEVVHLNEQVLPPRGEARSNHRITLDLASRLGLTHPELRAGEEATLRQLVDTCPDLPCNWEALKERKRVALHRPDPTVFPTPSGKVEFASSVAASRGFTPLPKPEWVERRDEFQLITPTHASVINSTYFHLAPFAPRLEVNPEDAAALRLTEGEEAELWNERGRLRLPVTLTARVVRGSVVTFAVPWVKHQAGGASVNDLTSDDVQAYGGNATFVTTFVKVRKAPTPEG